jgi:RimJ/RimL family protein N-acetyltransferase
VRLVVQFLVDHTSANEVHFLVLPENEASRRVAVGVGASERGHYTDRFGRTLVRHVLPLRSE